MNKTIIIILSVLSLLGIALIVVLLINNTQPKTPLPLSSYSTYTLSVNDNNGVIAGVLTANNTNFQLDNAAVEKYSTISFNNTNDLMWFSCPDGYNYSNPTSSTNNKVTEVPLLSEVSIDLVKDQNNNITVTCTIK